MREGNLLRFRFSPRDAKVWPYVVRSDNRDLDGRAGSFTAVAAAADRSRQPSTIHPNWWTDDPDPAVAEGIHPGAKTVNQWREDYLRDFVERLRRCDAHQQ